jgi:hypothetical protein
MNWIATSVWLACAASGLVAAASNGPVALAQPEPSLLAHWSFDEDAGASVLRDVSGHAALDVALERSLPRSRGVYGNALSLRGAHALVVRGLLHGSELSAITFSAWTRPTDLSGFREIFRQECPSRLLFSFQESGTILSLGLNIGGYVECDAPVELGRILDGGWHHCAATFDGEFMRVFLDGREIGSLPRPGKIAIQPEGQAFIGSMGGTGEHFQGALDDLRIYAAALSPEEIARLHRAGTDALAQRAAEIETALGAVYSAGSTFAETLTHLRRKIAESGKGVDEDLAAAVHGKLQASFPSECECFWKWTRARPADYLTTTDNRSVIKIAERLVELLLEYKPLTESQWQHWSADARRQWAEADQIKARYDRLVAQGDAAWFSPEWIDLIMEVGPRVQLRPVQHEAVAPYVKPETPAPRRLSAAEAREALERDWLHQADGEVTVGRIQSEIRWTRELAGRIRAAHAGRVDFAGDLAELEKLEKDALAAPSGFDQNVLPSALTKLYFQARDVKRRIVFKNPAVDFDKVLFVDMPFPQGSEWQHETRHRLGYMAVPGARLLTLEGLRPDGELRQLMPQAPLHGSFWRPDLSFDGKKVLFCFKPHNEKSFHLYEINVDGTDLRQLTDGLFDDLDPIYLPDGHLLFSTTRGHTYVRCMPPTSAFVLARCERDGRNVYLISANNEPDYLPSVMNDGRIIYTRWEYTDKPLWRAQKLWSVNPDGTQVLMFWGNQSVWPDVMKDARSIPGSRRVMFTGSAHHNWFSGAVGIIDPDQGFNFPWGLTKVTADLLWPECGNGPSDPVESPRYHTSGHYRAYYSPYPLSEQDFLVSAQRGSKFVLYLMDVDGNRELIYEGTHQVLHAMPLKPRQPPLVIADRVAWPSRNEPTKDGIIFSSSVYQGTPAELYGKVKFLRVFSIDHKTYTYWYKRPYISTGPVVSAVQSEGVKRLLGTVPVEADGSVSFHAPAGIPLHFQLLDENQRALQTMRSFVNVMPGEKRGCLGCHESHSRASEIRGNSIALTKTPHEITPPPWSDTTVSYPRYVQPVLDKYCGKCHQGEGEGRKTLDLTERPSAPIFTEPYLTLIGRPTWGQPYLAPENPAPGFGIAGCLLVEGYGTTDPKGYVTPPPMTSLSYRSKLIELVSSGQHHDVQVDDLSLQRLIVWVDAMCPYKGDEEVRAEADPVFQGVDWLAVRPKIASAPRITRPGPVD